MKSRLPPSDWTHPLGVVTGPTCSVGPAKGVAKGTGLIDFIITLFRSADTAHM